MDVKRSFGSQPSSLSRSILPLCTSQIFSGLFAKGSRKTLISLYHHPSLMHLMTRQDLLAVLLRRYTCARVVVGNARSAAIKTF